MDQSYQCCPPEQPPITAEEFTAALCPPPRSRPPVQAPTCSCGHTQSGDMSDPCQPQPVVCCCCQTLPTPQPVQVDEDCCCKRSFRAALSLLCQQEVATLLDFDQAAFLTQGYVAGGTLTPTVPHTGPSDNLIAITGSFRRFTLCSQDLLDVNAPLSTAPDTPTCLVATQVNLCQLTAAVFQLAAAAPEGDLTADQVAARNFRQVERYLSQRLTPCGGCDAPCVCPCERDDCCCAAGVLAALAQGNLSRRASLAAGPLLLNGVTLLGTVGSVLVLSNDVERRIYFVCAGHVQFLA